jgi:hypothetical protein
MTGPALTEPPSLRDFLAAGCDLAAVPGFELYWLVDAIDVQPARAAEIAAWYRAEASAWLRGDWSENDIGGWVKWGNPPCHTQGELCSYWWSAEALENPVLARAIRRAARR